MSSELTRSSRRSGKGARSALDVWLLLLAIIALILAVVANVRQATVAGSATRVGPAGLVDQIDRTNVLNAGYGVYPPYTQEDPNTKAVSGFSVEVVNEIAKGLGCKVVWHRLNWNTMSADLKRGDYDLIADPIFLTVPRAREFAFSEPYAFFADGIVVVRANDHRFASFDDLNRSGITISVGQGWGSETFARSRLSAPRIVPVQTSTDLLQVFNDVLSGRSDAAVVDGADAERFAKEHSGQVQVIGLDHPPASMPAGFALRPTDFRGAEFINACLRNLRSTGVLEGLARKYGIRPSEVAAR
jgi:ABC-type amino acid transport substrate-binding protein